MTYCHDLCRRRGLLDTAENIMAKEIGASPPVVFHPLTRSWGGWFKAILTRTLQRLGLAREPHTPFEHMVRPSLRGLDYSPHHKPLSAPFRQRSLRAFISVVLASTRTVCLSMKECICGKSNFLESSA